MPGVAEANNCAPITSRSQSAQVKNLVLSTVRRNPVHQQYIILHTDIHECKHIIHNPALLLLSLSSAVSYDWYLILILLHVTVTSTCDMEQLLALSMIRLHCLHITEHQQSSSTTYYRVNSCCLDLSESPYYNCTPCDAQDDEYYNVTKYKIYNAVTVTTALT